MRLRHPPAEKTIEIVSKQLEGYDRPRALKTARTFFPKAELECIGFVEWSTLRKIIKHKDVLVFSIVSGITIHNMPLFAVGFNTATPAVKHFDIKYFLKKVEKTVDKELELC